VVATSSYADARLPRLKAAARDAAEMAAVLADRSIGAFEVTSLADSGAQEVRLAVEDFLAGRGREDLVVVYLSCHGLLDARDRLYFAAADTRKDRLAATGVESSWLLDQLEECRAARQVVILDCCFSGAFARGAKGEADTDTRLRDRFIAHGRGRTVLTACKASERSWEGQPADGAVVPSVFTRALTEGLRSGAADTDGDGYISVDDAYAYAYERVIASGAGQTPQHWKFAAEGTIWLARSPAGVAVIPAALPEALRFALDSPFPAVRVGAVNALGEWLTDADPARSLAACQTLQRVAATDSPVVAAAAHALIPVSPPAAKSPGILPDTREQRTATGTGLPDSTAGLFTVMTPYSQAGPARNEGIRPTSEMVRQLDRDQPAAEPGAGRLVTAEWALWGKETDELEYRVLRCSEGTLSRQNFREIITRYASGAGETLPQYTACWAPDINGHGGYLAFGIHELADPDPRLSGGRPRTARGREIEYVRLFCVRYSEMAEHRVSYTELAEAVRGHQLPAGRTDPIQVGLRETELRYLAAPVRALAENVAALLQTNRPVCILGAEGTTPEDRLYFIDAVMSLLPYGLRATLSASTWASVTARNLRLRLYFTNAKRGDDGATLHLTWGQPVRLNLSAPELLPLRDYVNWLEHAGSGAAAELADQADPVRFNPAEIRQMVARLPRNQPVRDLPEELTDGIRRGDRPAVGAAVKRLKQRLASPPGPAEQEEYRQAIKRLGLFKNHPGLHHSTSASVYRVLLGLAFGPRISYRGYCEIEDCAGGPPRGELQREVLKFEFGSYLALLLTATPEGVFTAEELMASLHEQNIPATGPVEELSQIADEMRRGHRLPAYDFAVRYLSAYAADPRAELARRGYLAKTLETVFPGNPQEQRTRLEDTLRFVYGGTLSSDQVSELYGQPDLWPTAAFKQAVALLESPPKAGTPGTIRASQERAVNSRKAALRPWAAPFVLGLWAITAGVVFVLVELLLRAV
jgi:hypothetical protein